MTDLNASLEQTQFLNVIDRDEAQRLFHAAIRLSPLQEELVDLPNALNRVLSRDIVSTVNTPSFDRSNYDGFAVRAADTFGAEEEHPRRLRLADEVVSTAVVPRTEVTANAAVSIATGGMIPRGADAVVMVEHVDVVGDEIEVRRSVTPGFGISFAGTDISVGETVLRRQTFLSSRETGVLAAIGVPSIHVWRRPRVAIISTGDELIRPGEPMRPGMVYDSNARVLADAVRELGGVPNDMGIALDDMSLLRCQLQKAIQHADVVLLSGGTSKGAGDISYQVVRELEDPGIIAHGVALKPGKPICLAASAGKPIVVLPGFPTSAIFTFHEFVAPIIARLAGHPQRTAETYSARMAMKVNSEIGRTEFMLVGLVQQDATVDHATSLSAYPMGKGSGSVTTFSCADGFITIDRHQEMIEANSIVEVQLLGRELHLAEFVAMGSHCVGLDLLIGRLHDRRITSKFLAVGSLGGLEAAKRGECDVAGVHILDPKTETYNRPFLTDNLDLLPGYGRLQGIVFRPGDERFEGKSVDDVIPVIVNDERCVMVNRNQGSGTRILIDRLLGGHRPSGYAVQPRSHHAVAVAVAQHRADWGVAIDYVSRQMSLGFLPLTYEQFDFVVPRTRLNRESVIQFRQLLADSNTRSDLVRLGFRLPAT